MRKRILTRAIVAALGVSLTLGNAAPMTTYAQETVSVQEDVAEEATEEVIEEATEVATEEVQQEVVEADVPAQETQSETVDVQVIEQDNTLNQASTSGVITEETILEQTYTDSEGKAYSLKYQFRFNADTNKLEGAVIKGYGSKTTSRNITIPSTVSAPSTFDNYKSFQNVTVIAIDQNAFVATYNENDELLSISSPTSVYIPACVNSIGINAFSMGTAKNKGLLQTVIIEEGSQLEFIGDFAFQNQNILDGDIVIPEGVTYIGESAFEGCKSITSVTFNGAGVIGIKAFYDCIRATGSIDLSCGVETIGEQAFYNYGNSATDACVIKLPEGLTSIGDKAFYKAKLKGNIVIPASLETMGKNAFDSAFTQTSKGTLTFAGTSKLTTIPANAFNACTGLGGDLTIPNSVTTIDANAFAKCGFTGRLTLSSKLKTIGSSAFSKCENFTGALTIPNTVTSLGSSAFESCGFNGKLTIGSGITEIPSKAFFECEGLTGSITLPANLTKIGSEAFSGCYGLNGTLTIPSKVTTIGAKAFLECTGFTALNMSDSITSIGESAFDSCVGFSNAFKLPASLKTVEKKAFYNCMRFTGNLVMPDTVTSVGESAFQNMISLDGYLYISKNITRFGDYAFANCSGLRNQDDASGNDIIIEIPEGVKKLPECLFYGCESLTSILLPTSVTDIYSDVIARTNSALDIYVYSGSAAAKLMRDISANQDNFDIIYIDWLYKIVPSAEAITIRQGAERAITADLYYWKYDAASNQDKEVIIAEKDSDVKLQWTVSNTSYAKYANGKIVAIKAGNPTLTVVEPNTSVGATCKVKVVGTYVSSVKFDSTTKVSLDTSDANSKDVITATITFDGLAEAIKSGELTKDDIILTWAQSKADVVDIVPGSITISSDYSKATATATVKGKNSGSTSVTLTASFKGDAKTVKSSGKTYQIFVPLKGVSVKSNLSGRVGKSYTLVPTFNPAGATNKNVKWSTSDDTVATVSSAGKVTFKGEGTCIITCTPTTTDKRDNAEAASVTVRVVAKNSTEVVDSDKSSGDSNTGGSSSGGSSSGTTQTTDVKVTYHTHIQSYGDSQGTKSNGEMAGTSGEAKRLENIWINVSGNSNLGVQYSTHCQTYGWMPWSCNGETNGTSGEAKRLEAIKIQLTGADKDKYDIYYRVHAQSYGWLGWAKNGEPSGTAGYGKRLEGIQIVVVKKGAGAPALKYAGVDGSTSKYSKQAYVDKNNAAIVIPGDVNAPIVSYKTHVQSFGWQKWVVNGAMSGTEGKAKRLEGINIKVTNCPYDGDIVYTTHVQTYGWKDGKPEANKSTWKGKNGSMSGTSGEAKRLEAICIALTGEMAEHYDVYYRVHAQSYGWLGWAKNGEESGTAGYAKRLEGIQIVLVEKGGAAPGKSYGGITSKDDRPFVQK